MKNMEENGNVVIPTVTPTRMLNFPISANTLL